MELQIIFCVIVFGMKKILLLALLLNQSNKKRG